MKQRQFVIYFQAGYEDGVFVGTHAHITDGEYPSNTFMCDIIAEEHGFEDVAITGIQELPMNDFIDWLK